MKKIILKIFILFTGPLLFAQTGINTDTPSAELDIVSKGNTGATKALEINNSSSTEMITVLNNGNVGIGNTTPSVKLDINNGTVAGAIKITDGTQGEGKVLTSDANGLASWSATAVTSLYILSSNVYVPNGPSDFRVTTHPVPGVTAGSNERFLLNTNANITNLNPAGTFTSSPAGFSYKIPVNGLYRITLYVDVGVTGSRININAYRGTSVVKSNGDVTPGGVASTMINIWNLQAGDIVVPFSSGTIAGTNQLVETTFTIERVN